MNRALNVIALILLVASGWTLMTTASQRRMRLGEVERMKRLLPHAGSLSGVDVLGRPISADTDKDGHLRDTGHLLLFTLHNGTLESDLKMWRSALEDANTGTLKQRMSSLQVWAVCDEGTLCRTSVPHYVKLVGYLDPYQMRALVTASETHHALLYGTDQMLKSTIDLSGQPDDIAERLEKEIQ